MWKLKKIKKKIKLKTIIIDSKEIEKENEDKNIEINKASETEEKKEEIIKDKEDIQEGTESGQKETIKNQKNINIEGETLLKNQSNIEIQKEEAKNIDASNLKPIIKVDQKSENIDKPIDIKKSKENIEGEKK